MNEFRKSLNELIDHMIGKRIFKILDSIVDFLSSEPVEKLCDYLWIIAGVLFGIMFLFGTAITGYFLGLGFYVGLAAGIIIGLVVLWIWIDSKFYLASKDK